MFEESMKKAILEWDEDGLKKMCQSAIENKEVSPVKIIKLIGKIMQFVGDRFEREEIFLPDLVGSANTVKAAIDEVLDPAIKIMGEERKTRGKVVLGTVESDVHSIGKDLVGSFLFASGFDIYNLGVDVPAIKFIEKAEEVGAQVIALSSLLTMSMDFQRQVIQELKGRGLRNKYKVIVGGSPTSEEWAEKIGADGWADDAIEAVSLIKKLLT